MSPFCILLLVVLGRVGRILTAWAGQRSFPFLHCQMLSVYQWDIYVAPVLLMCASAKAVLAWGSVLFNFFLVWNLLAHLRASGSILDEFEVLLWSACLWPWAIRSSVILVFEPREICLLLSWGLGRSTLWLSLLGSPWSSRYASRVLWSFLLLFYHLSWAVQLRYCPVLVPSYLLEHAAPS